MNESVPHQKQRDILFLLLSVLAVYLILWSFTGEWPFHPSTYNSYVLQANRWLQGHLDLGQNYPYLEIAEYGGKYFISFPPIPSVLVLPLCLLFGSAAPDGLVAVAVGLIGAVYALKMAWLSGRKGASAVFWALFITAGSNFLHVGYCADVWYFAQTCAFTFTMLSLYHTMTDDLRTGPLPLFFLALAFGCRPLQIVYLPLVVWLLWKKVKRNSLTFIAALKHFWWWVIPPLCVGIFLMALNFARFGDPFQFGHDYLPEFAVEKENGQFHLSYLFQNWPLLWRLPSLEGGKLSFSTFNGCAFWLFSPIFLSFAVYFCKNIRRALKRPVVVVSIVLIFLHFAALCCHATMGGWQFGNRYTIDALPVLYFALLSLLREDPSDLLPLNYPLCFWGLGLNLTGTIALMNHWI